jgi:hypothetical protein
MKSKALLGSDLTGAEVGSHDDDGVLEIDLPAEAVRQVAGIKHLEKAC